MSRSSCISLSRSLPRRLLMCAATAPRLLGPPSPRPSPLPHLSPSLHVRRSLHRPLCLSRYRALVLARTVHSAVPNGDVTVASRLEELMRRLETIRIDTKLLRLGQNPHVLCPACLGGNSKEKSLSIFIDHDGESACWTCFRGKCGWRGHLKASGVKSSTYNSIGSVQGYGNTLTTTNVASRNKNYRTITEQELRLEPLCNDVLSYFRDRMISTETLRRNGVMQQNYGGQLAIAFPYRRNGILVNCKYRGPEKKFWQEKDTEKILYGLDDIVNCHDIIIVEGEMDKLAMEEAGFRNCVSVPDGAPSQVSASELPDKNKDIKFEYLWNCKQYLDKVSRIILATDADQPGQALAEELARRLGKERCWRVTWPMKDKDNVCKDANEVLMYLGSTVLREVIENAELYPIRGLFNFASFFQEIDAYYHSKYGYELGISTGWVAVDEYYKVVPGELTIVTGVPNSGKSEWIDALLCNINHNYGWKFVLCSMENRARDHGRKLLEKHIRKPFFDNVWYGKSVERMSIGDLEDGKKWLEDTFFLLRYEDDCLPNIKWVLDLAKAAVLRHGVRGLVIDPYNELDHQRSGHQSETEYVSQMLTMIKRFAQHHSCHVWFVAHPRQLQNWTGEPPSMYDISGSAHFINKCDNGIVIHRNRDKDAGPLDRVQVCVRKVRNKVVGGIGDAFLRYDRVTGEYFDIE